MHGMIERLKVRIMVRLTWKRSRASLLTSLRNFSETEADSAWHLLRAAEMSTDPAEKSELFGQVLEEMHHAAEFHRMYKELGGGHFVPLRLERKTLVSAPSDLWKFFIYCSVGEHVAATRFKNIHDAIDDGPLKDVLRGILRDEAQHVHSADELARGTEVSLAARQAETRRIKARRLWEAWLRSGRFITDGVATALLAVVYYLVGALGSRAARTRLAGGQAADAAASGLPALRIPKAVEA